MSGDGRQGEPKRSDTPTGPRWAEGGLLDRIPRLSLAVVGLVVGAGLAAYGATGFQARYWADDFCIASATRELGLIDTTTAYYSSWSGRFTSTAISGIASLAGPNMARAWAGVLILAWLPILALAIHGLSARLTGRRDVLAASVLASGLLLAYLRALPNRTESVLWLAGSISYTVPLILGTALLGLLAQEPGGRSFRAVGVRSMLAFALAFLAAGASETYLPLQTSVLAAALLLAVALPGMAPLRRLRVELTAALAGSVGGGLLVALAPGNQVRAVQEADPPLATTAIAWQAASEAAAFFMRTLADPAVMLGAGMTALAVALLVARPRIRPGLLLAAAVSVVAIGLALVAATWLPALLVLHHSPPSRAMAPATLTLVAAAAGLGAIGGLATLAAQDALVVRNPLRDRNAFERPLALRTFARLTFGRRIWLAAASLVLVAGSLLVVRSIVLGEMRRSTELGRLAEAWDARDRDLTGAAARGDKTAVVSLIPGVASLEDVTLDSAHWLNACVADYYRLETVTGR